jgi:DNA topoisomerase IB
VPRLRTVSPSQSGLRRRRQGKGFCYLDGEDRVTDPAILARIRDLVIPPAWQDVWICRWPNGHIQAVGTDDAGRRQYLYHPAWRELRDRQKHDRMLDMAARLPRARKRVAEHLELPGMPRDRALATAFRLLDLGFFRIGGESYAEQNGSYGLATILREHVRVEGDQIIFEYTAK